MAKVKNLKDLLAEQAVRKAVATYSRGADRCDLEILKSAFHDDAEVKYGSYDGHYAEFCQNVVDGHLAMNYTRTRYSTSITKLTRVVRMERGKFTFLLFFQHLNQAM